MQQQGSTSKQRQQQLHSQTTTPAYIGSCATPQQKKDQTELRPPRNTKQPGVQVVAAAAAGAATAVGAAAKAAAVASAGWLAIASGSWLDSLLGYDARLGSTTDAPATAKTAQAGVVPAKQAAAATHKRLSTSAGQVGCNSLSQQQRQQQQGAAGLQLSSSRYAQQPVREAQNRSAAVTTAAGQHRVLQQPAQQQRATAAKADTPPAESLGVFLAAFAALAAVAFEVSDAAVSAYTDMLKPAAEVLWQLAAAVGGLIGVLVLYLLLPLLRVCTAVLRWALLSTGRLLQRCTGQVKQYAAVSGTGTAAVVARDGSAAAESIQAAASAADASTSQAQQQQQTQLHLLALAQQQLAASSRHHPGFVVDFSTLRSSCGNFSSSARLQASAGSGPCAYKGRLAGAPVAVMLSILHQEQAIAAWCEAAGVLRDLRHPQLLLCMGATVGLLTTDTCTAAAVAARAAAGANAAGSSSSAAVGRTAVAAAPAGATQQQQREHEANGAANAGMVVAGCLVYQLLQEPFALSAALQGSSCSNSNSTLLASPARTATSASRPRSTGMAAGVRSPIAGREVGNLAAVPAAAGVFRSGLARSSGRLQLAPQIVAGLQYVAVQLASQTGAGPAIDGLDGHAAAAATAAANAHRLSSWWRGLTPEQLAAAVVLDGASLPLQLKLNPALLLFREQAVAACMGSLPTSSDSTAAAAGGVGVHDVTAGPSAGGSLSATNATAESSDGLLPALGRVLLMLLAGGTAIHNSSGMEQLHQMMHARAAANLLPQHEQSGLGTPALDVLNQALEEAVQLLASQKQQPTVRQGQRSAGRARPTFSAAAAEEVDSEGQADEDGNHPQGGQPSAVPAAAAVPSPSRGWVPRWLWGGRNPAVAQPDTISRSSGIDARHDGGSVQTTAVTGGAEQQPPPAAAVTAVAAAAVQFDWDKLLHTMQRLAGEAAAWQEQEQQKLASPSEGRSSSSSSEPPAYFICPITSAVMSDPVVAPDGFTYERSAIAQWLQVARACRSPMTNQPMEPILVPNHSLRSSILEWRLRQQQQESQQHQ